MASATAIGNAYVDHGERTASPCARCVAFFAGGNVRYLGKTGCIFVPVTAENCKLWEHSVVHDEAGKPIQRYVCFRCSILGQSCLGVGTLDHHGSSRYSPAADTV
ncbi:hypothetical protein EJ02DRAFT_461057 [Clathrospora elynae]|uniref:Uncharacterized protein n=1 Tax=Clathrospora elynae TaxID=706981 RepID=A0A6A5S3A8_9PLEO|nr:hypothetical protein EJ02DRAFT_461057 [Clathrospora elynae]